MMVDVVTSSRVCMRTRARSRSSDHGMLEVLRIQYDQKTLQKDKLT